MDWTDIEAQLRDRAEETARHLLPNGKKDGAEWVCGSVAGEAGKSLKVNIGHGKAGLWSDFAGGGGGKTFMSLWCAVTGKEFKLAIREAKAFLGISDDFDRRVQSFSPKSHRPADSTSQSLWRNAREVWQRSQPLVEGGPVWRYLVEGRQIAPEMLALYDVRELISRNAWIMVFPYFSAPDDRLVAKVEDALPSWMKLEALDRDANGKKRDWTSVAPEKCLWGMQVADSPVFRHCRDLLICEGEKDALSWATYGAAAWGVVPVSVPFGAKWRGEDKARPSPNREWLDRCWPWMQRFETVLVAMDSDEAGNRAAVDIINEVGPRRCRLVRLPEKPNTKGDT